MSITLETKIFRAKKNTSVKLENLSENDLESLQVTLKCIKQ